MRFGLKNSIKRKGENIKHDFLSLKNNKYIKYFKRV